MNNVSSLADIAVFDTRWRSSSWVRWMGNPLSFAIGMPVLTMLGLATSLFIPRLLSPQAFGAYALLLDICRYAMQSDFGLSQLADRRIAGGLDNAGEGEGERILAARWRLGFLALMFMVPAATAFAVLTHKIAPIDAAIATSAGVIAMVAGGPSTIYRARGDVWMYTALAFMFSIGFTGPRLVGVVLGGTTGCFGIMLLWNALIAAAFIRTSGLSRRYFVNTADMVRAALPMFIFAAAWTLYLSAGRWIASTLCEPTEFGLFALSANLVFTGVTTIGIISDVRYPTWLRQLGSCESRACGRRIVREACMVAIPVTIVIAGLIPMVHPLLGFIFPNYIGADDALATLACASVPLSVLAWFLPVMIARSSRPAADASILFGPASLVLLIGMMRGHEIAGLNGLAWGSCVSALFALGGMALLMERSHVLSKRAAVCFLALPSICLLLLLSAVVATTGSHRASVDGFIRDFSTHHRQFASARHDARPRAV